MPVKIKVVCEGCGVEFERNRGEVNRSRRVGRKNWCSLRCVGEHNHSHLETPEKGVVPANFVGKAVRVRDEYSPFREYLRRANQRKHRVDVTLEDLKGQWDLQGGRCPLTGWVLDHDLVGSFSPNQPSLDRIDAKLGYVKGNVRYVAMIVQFAKNCFDDADVIEFAEAVVQHRRQVAA